MRSRFKPRSRFSGYRRLAAFGATILFVAAAPLAAQDDASRQPSLTPVPSAYPDPSGATHVPLAVSFAVVANASVPVSEMTIDDLRNVFLFRKKFWSGGKRVVLLLPASGLDARSFILADIYRLNDAGLKRLILERLFQGEIDAAPRAVDSYQDALSFLAATRGMLSIVRADAVPPGQTAVKVIRINGKLPGEAGYPLAR
ncbi:MAG: hypothetical protein ACR2G6_08770 [Gemmatimonadaceae bacterium]